MAAVMTPFSSSRPATLISLPGMMPMDMSFSIQALALEYLKNRGRALPPDVYEIPQSIDDTVSALKLHGIGMEIDHLTPAQEAYLAGWTV